MTRKGGRGRVVVKAVFEKFSGKAIKAVMKAQQEAKGLFGQEVTSEHLVLGIIAEDQSFQINGFYGTGLTVEKVRKEVIQRGSGAIRESRSSDLPFSSEAKKVFEAALNESRKLGMSFIGPEHILIAITSDQSFKGRQLLKSMMVDCGAIQGQALNRLQGQVSSGENQGRKKLAGAGVSGARAGQQGQAQAVSEQYCRDLCADAKKGKIDPVIGRDKEILRMSQILSRRQKNNPILLGEPGVGKTAIAEGLALAIVQGQNVDGTPLPATMLTKRILQLDVGLLIAGCKERGEVETRVTRLMAELKADPHIILMIDEVHVIVGAGSVHRAGGGLDLANLLKPALARGEMRCIGATTLDEYRKYFQRDRALDRRFQPVHVAEPSQEDSLQILQGLQDKYERHHRCTYTQEAVEAAVTLAERYINDRFLPDKAIDVLDEAGSSARIAAYLKRRDAGMKRTDVNEQYKVLSQILDTKEEAVKGELWEEASLLRERELEHKSKIAGSPMEPSVLPVVGQAEIEAVISRWTGVPLEQLSDEEQTRLSQLEESIEQHIIGQEVAVNSTVRAIKRACTGLRDPKRPIATLFFSGPTGVGKTQLAKVLAEKYYGSRESIIRLDMSEYMDRFSVSKLIGAPPGYVGFEDGGKLTEQVRRRPYSLLLLDEVEKAHPDVWNMLLQITEDGRLTDSKGRVVSFKNCLIILTSNVGSNIIANGGGRLGFSFASGEDEEDESYDQIKSLVHEEMKNYFRPELLNRIDEIIVFRKLMQRSINEIAKLIVDETRERLQAQGIGLFVCKALFQKVCEEGYDEVYGARPLRTKVSHLIDDPITDAVLSGKVKAGDTAIMDVGADGVVVTTGQVPIEMPGEDSEGGGIVFSAAPTAPQLAPVPVTEKSNVSA